LGNRILLVPVKINDEAKMLILGLSLFFPTISSVDMVKDQDVIRWDANSRNYLQCSKKNLFLRIFCEPAEFIGNIGPDWPLNILEEG
jgi:hypothetical protein